MIGVLFLLILFFNWSGFTGCVNEEAVSLFAFKEAINEDPENALSNWNISDENPCSWNGISCKENRVISLSIPKKYLKGFVPSVLGSLSFLRHVNLRNNKLHGTIPVELFQVQGLQSLVLYGNNMTGSLPLQIGKLRYLQILDLSGNLFNGSIPTSLLDCKRLKNLILSHNSFTDSLPRGFGSSFPILEKLDLSYNRLNGSIPSDLGNLSSIQETVDLSHNLFSSSIPASLGNLPEKIYIDLSYNNLSGPIPENGALGNRGPTAFMGNPLLCGPPLKNLCSQTSPVNSPPSSNIPFLPTNHPPPAEKIGIKHKGLSKIAVIAIIASDAVAIAVIGMAFLYWYCKAVSSHSKDETGGSRKGEDKWKKECLCLCKEESETFSENAEQFDLVPLDLQVGFDLDELLRASAFVLGKTGNGIVYKVVLEDGLTLAVRRLGEGGSQRCKEFQMEVEAIGKIRHPNIVTLRAYYWSIDEKLLIYDYIPNGNLVTAIHGKAGMNAFTPMPWCVRVKIIKGIAKGLAYLHEFSPKKYVHGDLKPTNILLGSNMEPYISDFGLGRLATIAGGSPTVQSARMAADSKQTQYSEISGSLISSSESCYQAPEALKVLKPSQKWDVYSYGVILLEMVSGKLPLVLLGTSEMDLVRWVQFCIEEKKPFADVLDPVLAQEQDSEGEIVAVLKIALACVQNNPDRRPTMKHVSYVLDRLTGNG